MNITFMIGNGFDLHLGMKTRFTDMYEGYIQSPSEDIVIQRFKEDLKESPAKDTKSGAILRSQWQLMQKILRMKMIL